MAKEPPYSKDEIALVTKLYPNTFNAEIGKLIGRTQSSVNKCSARYGLKKDPAFLAQISRDRWHNSLTSNRKMGYFTKGQPSYNKGTKMAPDVKAKISHNFFKKGSKPHNTKPIGYRSIDVCGYHKIKTDKGMEFVHRLVWEEHNGAIPHNYLVTFKDGNKDNCDDINNLALVNRRQNMDANSIANYPPEVRQTINLISKLKKTIKNGNTKTD